MIEKITKQCKIKLRIVDQPRFSKDDQWSKLKKINEESSNLLNHVTSIIHTKENVVEFISKSCMTPTDYNKLDIKEKHKLNKKTMSSIDDFIKNISSQKSINGSFYRSASIKYPDIPSNIIPSLIKKCTTDYRNNWVDIKMGKRTINNYKRSSPIPIIKKYLNFKKVKDKNYQFYFPSKILMETILGSDKSNDNSIIEKCISKEYKILDSEIEVNEKGLFLRLSFQFDKKDRISDESLSVGVDLGLSNTAVISLNNGEEREVIKNDILKSKIDIQNSVRRLQSALKYSKGGKGRKKKMKKIDNLKGKEKNINHNINHNISRKIVNFAYKNNAHKIYLENLKNINTNKFILRNWTYHQLQSMIEYKAKEVDILVEYIDPCYTSQVCNVCKSKGERISQSEFICKNNDCKEDKINADYNASKNISNGGVGLSYNKETKKFFESLEMGQVVLPEVEGQVSTRQVLLNNEIV